MSPAQEQHLTHIKLTTASNLDKKYRKGQAEHGGNLWDRNPFPELAEEITDLITYAHEVESRRNDVSVLIKQAISSLSERNIEHATNLLEQAYKLLN